MGRIFKNVNIAGAIGGYKKFTALFDTGAKDNYIREEFFNGTTLFDLGIIEYREPELRLMANGSLDSCQKIKLKSLKIPIGLKKKVIIEPEFLILKDASHDVIIGAKTMQKLKISLYPTIKEINFN